MSFDGVDTTKLHGSMRLDHVILSIWREVIYDIIWTELTSAKIDKFNMNKKLLRYWL